MNMQSPLQDANAILDAWRKTAGTKDYLEAQDVQRALVSKGAQIELIRQPSHCRANSPIESYLSVTYNNETTQIRFAGDAQETVHPPQGLVMYNMLNRMIACL